jgi:protein TonB
VYFLIGLVISLTLVITIIEYRTYDQGPIDLGELDIDIEDEIIPITHSKQKAPPPPPPPIEVIEVAPNDIELKLEIEIESAEINQEEVIEDIKIEPEDPDEIFKYFLVENRPVFPGCENEPTEEAKFACFQRSLMTFVARNVDYPEMARQMGVQGRVYVSFVVEKNGSISNVRVDGGVDQIIDNSAANVVSKLPRMKPAKQSGRAVRMSYTVPIQFKLQ